MRFSLTLEKEDRSVGWVTEAHEGPRSIHAEVQTQHLLPVSEKQQPKMAQAFTQERERKERWRKTTISETLVSQAAEHNSQLTGAPGDLWVSQFPWDLTIRPCCQDPPWERLPSPRQHQTGRLFRDTPPPRDNSLIPLTCLPGLHPGLGLGPHCQLCLLITALERGGCRTGTSL